MKTMTIQRAVWLAIQALESRIDTLEENLKLCKDLPPENGIILFINKGIEGDKQAIETLKNYMKSQEVNDHF